MDLTDLNLIKKIDAHDTEEYRRKSPEQGSRENSVHSIGSFDGEDDDLADLLFDDDEAKKKSANKGSPLKVNQNNSPKKFQVNRDSSRPNSGGSRSRISTRESSPGSGFFSSSENVGTKPVIRPTRSKIDLFLEDEKNYISDLHLHRLEELSPTSGFSNDVSLSPDHKPTPKRLNDVEFNDGDNDILSDLDNSNVMVSSSKSKPELGINELMGKNTPNKHKSLQKMSFENEAKKTEDEEGDDTVVYGGYVPSASPRRSIGSRRLSVTFKDEGILPSTPSPSKEQKKRTFDVYDPKRNPRSLAFLNDPSSRTTTPTQPPTRQQEFARTDTETDVVNPVNNSPSKPNMALRRKSSGGEWLGFDASQPTETVEVPLKTNRPRPRDFDFSSLDEPSPTNRASNSTPIKKVSSSVVSSSSNIIAASAVIGDGLSLSNERFSANTVAHKVSVETQPNVASQEMSSLEGLVQSLQVERNQLRSKEIEASRKESDLKVLEMNLKQQQKENEDAFEGKMGIMKRQYEEEIQRLGEQLNSVIEEKRKLTNEYQNRLMAADQDYCREAQRLKQLHEEALMLMKQNHEDAMCRLTRIKDQEIEAVSSVQQHSRSLQLLSDKLDMRASELAALQKTVEDKHLNTVQERENVLNAREKELRALEHRLRWQTEQGEQERTRLQELVLHLEKRLQQQTKDSEVDRWDVLQMKAKLEVQQKFLDQESKIMLEGLEREKEKLQGAQNSLLQEQKDILTQLAQEQQQIRMEKVQLETLAKRVKDDGMRFNAHKIKEETALQNQHRFLDEESAKIHLEKELMQQDLLNFRREREALERERRLLRVEKDKLHQVKLELQQRSEELDDISRRAEADKEEGRIAKVSARKVESDHAFRMSQCSLQMDGLMEKQKIVLQEKDKLIDERREFEQNKANTMCINCKMAVGLPITSLPPTIIQPSVLASVPTYTRDPSLMVWYLTAKEDHDYLDEELAYWKAAKADKC